MSTKSNRPLMVDPTEMFPKVENLIYKQAWNFTNRYPISFEDAKSEAYYGFVKACYLYKPDGKRTFSSWCYFIIWCKLTDLVQRRAGDLLDFVEEPLGADVEDSELSKRFEQEVLSQLEEELSDLAKVWLRMLLNTPKSLLRRCNHGEHPTPTQLMDRLENHFIRKGMKRATVRRARKELRTQVKWVLA